MKEKIRQLMRLQDCDNHIKNLLQRQKEAPLRIQKLEEEMHAVERETREVQERVENLLKERRKIEREVQDLDVKAEKSAIKLSIVKSNKEYTAALKEIDDLKSLKFSAEDKVLQCMEEIEELEGRLRDQQKKKRETEEKVKRGIAAIEGEMKDLARDLQEREEARLHLTEGVDPGLLKTYLLLRERRAGQAITAVIRGVCQTCHLGFPPQRFNELLKCESLLTCPHCNRLAYWGEDQDFQLGPNEV